MQDTGFDDLLDQVDDFEDDFEQLEEKLRDRYRDANAIAYNMGLMLNYHIGTQSNLSTQKQEIAESERTRLLGTNNKILQARQMQQQCEHYKREVADFRLRLQHIMC